MPRIAYVDMPNFRADTLAIIDLANEIASSYKRRGFNLTLRQLYYQFIARDFFPNSEKSYDKLGRIISGARLAGLFDWEHLEDRAREAHGVDWLGTGEPDVSDIIRAAQYHFSVDLWEGQSRRVEIWVEKQALEEVASKAANGFRVGYFACKGYVSQSEMWGAGMRMREAIDAGQTPLVLHLGDHDPSGIDMTRDIGERLSLFAEEEIEVKRIALNMGQIRELNPPPNPAKLSDSRATDYVARYGSSSWELDAIEPEALVRLIRSEIAEVLDREAFDERCEFEAEGRQMFDHLADRWDDAREILEREDII